MVPSSLERAAKTRLWQRAESRQDRYVLAFALPKTAMDIAVQPQAPVIVSITFQSKFMAVPGCGRDPRPGEKCMSPALSALLSPNTVLALGGVGEPVEGLRICLELLLGTDLAKVSAAESEVADSGLEVRLMGLWGLGYGADSGELGPSGVVLPPVGWSLLLLLLLQMLTWLLLWQQAAGDGPE